VWRAGVRRQGEHEGSSHARRPSVEQISRIGMDTSKQVFQLGVNTAKVPILRQKLRRKEMVTFFQKTAAAFIGPMPGRELGLDLVDLRL
jgi:transposase